ncbi:uroporphyrinogen-III synthase [Sulfurimonas sp. C5]|uniref:uroporphyrinogen-III synthase n=1 Tax=Sulfurimonas sp. C5 TaxID=3036947 RepID=UPI0024552AB2|nr:uroporphyrinogen-III synthase [Sulfurimonas sp. C5]MDH4944577.1 uroporphyrinogen-III synthase [Sulfurimonas sp. C5]
MSKKIYLFSTTSHPETKHINSLDTKFFTPEIDFSLYDSLIITSKQVIRALEQYEKEKYINKAALCVSMQTAKSFENIGGTVLKTGSGYGENLGNLITKFPKEMKWLYLRAKNIASDFVTQTKELGYDIDEVIVYETFCSKSILKTEVENDAVLIFTSPSSVECFLKNNKIKDTQKIVVIGKTTAKALPKNSNFVISAETTIDSCVKIAKTL